MKDLSKSPLWPLVFACAASLAGCRNAEQHPVLTIPVNSTGVPVGFRDISKLPGTVFHVTYTPATVRIDLPTAQKSLTSVSDDGRVLVFDSDDARLHRLKQGSVLFLEHLGVRRVDAVNIQGSQVAVLTETASLPDLVQDGTVQFKVPVDFSQLASRTSLSSYSKPEPLGNIFDWFSPPVAYASAPEFKYTAKVKAETDGWEFELEGEPEGTGVALTLTAAKKKLCRPNGHGQREGQAGEREHHLPGSDEQRQAAAICLHDPHVGHGGRRLVSADHGAGQRHRGVKT